MNKSQALKGAFGYVRDVWLGHQSIVRQDIREHAWRIRGKDWRLREARQLALCWESSEYQHGKDT